MKPPTLLLAVLAIAACGDSASAQAPCTTRAELMKVLDKKYGETQLGFGMIGERNLVEIYVSENGSFTLVSSSPNGVSCIIAAGQNWNGKSAPAKGKDL
jgi:hypothetical protein